MHQELPLNDFLKKKSSKTLDGARRTVMWKTIDILGGVPSKIIHSQVSNFVWRLMYIKSVFFHCEHFFSPAALLWVSNFVLVTTVPILFRLQSQDASNFVYSVDYGPSDEGEEVEFIVFRSNPHHLSYTSH